MQCIAGRSHNLYNYLSECNVCLKNRPILCTYITKPRLPIPVIPIYQLCCSPPYPLPTISCTVIAHPRSRTPFPRCLKSRTIAAKSCQTQPNYLTKGLPTIFPLYVWYPTRLPTVACLLELMSCPAPNPFPFKMHERPQIYHLC